MVAKPNYIEQIRVMCIHVLKTNGYRFYSTVKSVANHPLLSCRNMDFIYSGIETNGKYQKPTKSIFNPIKFFITPGLGCLKLTTSSVNVLLKFQMLISQNCQNILLKKCEKL